MKKIISILITILILFDVTVLADVNEPFVIYEMSNYKIIADRFSVAAPHQYAGPVYTYDNYGVVDTQGNVIIEQKYQGILPQTEGRAAFVLDGKIGFFDENWNVCIENKYYSNSYPINDISFSEGLAAVAKKDDTRYMVWGYIDRDGNEVIDFKYDFAKPFENGFAKVGIDEYVYSYNTKTKYGKIDKVGNIVEPFKFGYATGNDYEYLWQEPIEVQLSQNLVELNGTRYNNSHIEYPFINYLGYSYIPLTYHGCRMLGINCDWTETDGIVLSNGGIPDKDIIGYTE